MEKELNYLSDLIEEKEHQINLCKFSVECGYSLEEEVKSLQEEKQILENILNGLTQKEIKING